MAEETCVNKEPINKKENSKCYIALAILMVSNILLIGTILTLIKYCFLL